MLKRGSTFLKKSNIELFLARGLYPSGGPATTNGLSPVACTVCGLPAIEAELALVLEFEPPLERPLCGLTGVGRYTICQAQ